MSQSCRNQEDGVVVGEDPNPPEESSGSLSLLPGLFHQSAAPRCSSAERREE